MKLYLVIFVLCLGGIINNVSYATPGDGVPKKIKRKNIDSTQGPLSKKTKKRCTLEEKKQHLVDYNDSDLSPFGYSEVTCISESTLRRWITSYNDKTIGFTIDGVENRYQVSKTIHLKKRRNI